MTAAGARCEGADRERMRSECVRIAQQLQAKGRRAIGFCPAGPDVAVPPLLERFADCLLQLAGGPVALVDANVRYPAFPPASEGAADHAQDESIFSERWVRPEVALLSPRWIGEAGAGVRQLELILSAYADRFGHLLADLTGFEQLGDLLNASALLDGVVIVARAGRTDELDLVRLRDQLPAERNLGVVLAG
jgi:hypothetical protein